MLHIGIVFIVFGVFLCGAGIIPDEAMSWNVFSKVKAKSLISKMLIYMYTLIGSSSAWWNEVTCTGLFSFGLGLFLLILNCLISRKEEEDLEDYVQRQLTRSRSGNKYESAIDNILKGSDSVSPCNYIPYDTENLEMLTLALALFSKLGADNS